MKKYNVPDEIKKKYPYASWVGGRGWAGHKTYDTARRAARRAANDPAYGGYPPAVIIVDCATGRAV